jgi:hypothetical protein
MFITKNKTFETERVVSEQLLQGHSYVMRHAPKTFTTEVLFIDWLQAQFVPKTDQLCIKANCDGHIILLLDGRASHTTPRRIAYTSSQKTMIVRLVAH